VDFIEEIRSDYELLSEYALEYKNLRPEQLKDFRRIFLDIKTRIPEIQELINKKLEEL
jgi:hypothetical protein